MNVEEVTVTNIQELEEEARNHAHAAVFKLMANEEEAARSLERFAARPDEQIDEAARFSGIPEHQFSVCRAIIRGEANEYFTKLSELSGTLQSGDVILVPCLR